MGAAAPTPLPEDFKRLHCGWLEKQGALACSRSQRRWFVLSAGRLDYFDDDGGQHLGSIPLAEGSEAVANSDQPAALTLSGPECARSYELAADNPEECEAWRNAISGAVLKDGSKGDALEEDAVGNVPSAPVIRLAAAPAEGGQNAEPVKEEEAAKAQPRRSRMEAPVQDEAAPATSAAKLAAAAAAAPKPEPPEQPVHQNGSKAKPEAPLASAGPFKEQEPVKAASTLAPAAAAGAGVPSGQRRSRIPAPRADGPMPSAQAAADAPKGEAAAPQSENAAPANAPKPATLEVKETVPGKRRSRVPAPTAEDSF
eukprot:TRINITY_DN40407_c0_g1_i1.p1 TRINITY_DN40407_c0_g1~~TRINITY_DN40407_c0_g1_i1.p1  ORF type:complete len:313 (-),score=72.81 TRINITY_DN40407_c0_g1_i1:508-1446(-)